jgi:putative transposase
MRYVELNPVRAILVKAPGEYRWSSYRANALGETDRLVKPHSEYLALGTTPEYHQEAYRELIVTEFTIDPA